MEDDRLRTNGMGRPPRITVQLSETEYKLLTLWAKWHGRQAATYASQIIGARIEANRSVIGELVAEAAKLNGITVEEQIDAWLTGGDDDDE